MSEIKEIPGFLGYGATADGRIWSKWGMGYSGLSSDWRRELKQSRMNGYLKVGLCGTGKQVTKSVHSLVWAAFNGWCPKGKEINHKDGNKHNNALKNLEVVTPSGNVRHSFSIGLHPRGSDRPFSKLNQQKVREIRLRLAAGDKKTDLAQEFGVTFMAIHKISVGKTWAEVEGV